MTLNSSLTCLIIPGFKEPSHFPALFDHQQHTRQAQKRCNDIRPLQAEAVRKPADNQYTNGWRTTGKGNPQAQHPAPHIIINTVLH